MAMSLWIVAFGIAALSAVIGTRAMISVGIGDDPDAARKLHTKRTPTSGGVGIMFGVVTATIFVVVGHSASISLPLVACLLGSVLAGGLGLLDDIYVLGAKLKLAVMIGLTGILAIAFVRIEALTLAPFVSIPLGFVVGALGTMLWLLVLVNCVNFMDGANGLSMGCSGIGLAGLSVLLIMQNHNEAALLALIAAGASAGFLVWNAGRGAIFAGDSGALFVGLMSATLGAYAVSRGVNPLCVAMCFLPLLVDAIWTIIWRLKQGENILTPHNHHAYQRAIRAGATHSYTASRYWIQALVCVFGALIGALRGGFTPILAFVILLAALSFIYVQTLKITALK
jgi:UDP-GlcNAc:undecaprenyl-phosphate/decaprenyl-phosphate GlcNAc-1-phosphate transferase